MRIVVAQIMQLELLEQRLDFGGVGQKRRHNYDGLAFGRNAVAKIHFRQDPGRDAQGNDPMDQADGNGQGRYEKEQNGRYQLSRSRTGISGVKQSARESEDGKRPY